MSPGHPIPNSYWASEGQLLAGPHPGVRRDGKASLTALVDAGVRTIVDLTVASEAQDSRVALGRLLPGDGGAVFVRLPILDGGTPGHSLVKTALDLIDAELARDRVVYVHCMGGLGRTGTIVGCWWVRHGHCEPQDVVDRLREARAGQPNGDRPSPETVGQRSLVASWRPGL